MARFRSVCAINGQSAGAGHDATGMQGRTGAFLAAFITVQTRPFASSSLRVTCRRNLAEATGGVRSRIWASINRPGGMSRGSITMAASPRASAWLAGSSAPRWRAGW